jgi:hypothetical protein
MKINLKLYILFVLCFSLAFSCTSSKRETDAVMRVVTMYNAALINTYASNSIKVLRHLTTARESRKVDSIVSGYMSGDRRMEAELHELAFESVKVTGVVAKVITREYWTYRWVNDRTEEEIVPMKEGRYRMLYTLLKEDKNWLVDTVAVAPKVDSSKDTEK